MKWYSVHLPLFSQVTTVEEHHVNYYRVGITTLHSARNSVKTTKNNFLEHCKALTYSHFLTLVKINVKFHNVVLIATDELRFLFRKTTSIASLPGQKQTEDSKCLGTTLAEHRHTLQPLRQLQCSFVALEAEECQVVWRGEQHHCFGNSQHFLVLLSNNQESQELLSKSIFLERVSREILSHPQQGQEKEGFCSLLVYLLQVCVISPRKCNVFVIVLLLIVMINRPN